MSVFAAPDTLRRTVDRSQIWPSVRTGVLAVALFALGLWLARRYAGPVGAALSDHAAAGVAIFFASAVVAVLAPMLTNLALLPLAVVAWGPAPTAALLLAGWIVGSALSFALGRYARGLVLRGFPSVARHARIDRLIDPRHRLLSLVLLRMTFPVDVLSYALGLFSQRTTLAETCLSTAVGAAPFALAFALFPTLSTAAQAWVFGLSVLAFVLYVRWVLRRPTGEADTA